MGHHWTKYKLNQLNQQEIEHTIKYAHSFDDKTFLGKIVSVYDGDTCTAIVKIHGKYMQIVIRCLGYDTPEMKPLLSLPNRTHHIELAQRAKRALEDKILNKMVFIHVTGFDKYGRFLGTLYLSDFKWNSIWHSIWNWKTNKGIKGYKGENINEYMITNGYGVEYSGGKKTQTFI